MRLARQALSACFCGLRFGPSRRSTVSLSASGVTSRNSSFVNISSPLAAFAHNGTLTIRKLPHVSIIDKRNAIRSRLVLDRAGQEVGTHPAGMAWAVQRFEECEAAPCVGYASA
jgi:hypothetical protein